MIRRAAVMMGVVVLFGCSSDPSTIAGHSSPPPTSTSTTTTTPTVPVTVPISPASSPTEAATKFASAWRDGNQLAALTIALPSAVQSVFDAGAPGFTENRGCNRPPPDSPVLCVYRTAIGELQVRVQPQPDGGWVVDQAIVSPA